MLNKRILVLIFLLVFLPLVGCFPSPAPPITENQAPIITSIPITSVTVGETYVYDVKATDPDGDTLTYSLSTKPTGMTIGPATGLIKWTPKAKGNYAVTVKVSDGALSDTQSFTIVVSKPSAPPPVNHAPIITSIPNLTSLTKIVYIYDVKAIDPDGDILTYLLTTKPKGMTINSTTGVIKWIPISAQVGNNPVIVKVSDGALSDTQSFTIKVSAVELELIVIKVIPKTMTLIEGGSKTITSVTAYYSDGSTAGIPLGSCAYASSATNIAKVSNGKITAVSEGSATVTVSYKGKSDTLGVTVSKLPAVNHPPIITSTPGNTAIVDELYTYEIEATDPDGDVLTYSLITKPEGMTITSNIVSWTPTEGQIGYHDFVIKVSDGQLFTTRGSYIMVRELWLELTGITVEPKTMDLIVGDSDTIDSVTATYEFRSYEDPIDLRDCTFLTSDSEVATVEKVVGYVEDILITTVTVTAVGVGTADILVGFGGKFDTVEVTVKAFELIRIEALPNSFDLWRNLGTRQLTVTAYYNDESTADITLNCEYSNPIYNIDIVSVDNIGLVTAEECPGIATITVFYTPNGITWSDTVEVTVLGELVVTQLSPQNAINKAADHPYIDWTIDGHCIEFVFVNPTTFSFAFDYRVDGEEGTITEWSSIPIKPGGELGGQEIGPSYNIVNTPPGETKIVEVCAEEEVQVGLRLGAENDWYLDWIIFKPFVCLP